MALFSRKKKNNEMNTEVTLRDEFTSLSDIGDPQDIGKADNDVKEAVTEAARSDMRDILMIDQGRCPTCHARTESFLFTVVCPSCGWYRRRVPEKGKSTVLLNDGEKITCDYVHRGKEEYLCIRDGVVVAEVMRTSVDMIRHDWKERELEEVRQQQIKYKTGLCSWCEKQLSEVDPDEIQEDYSAFGAVQEHYVFCSEKCQKAFRKQYPSRIHRNCYETDCNTCSQCIAKFDTKGFTRKIYSRSS